MDPSQRTELGQFKPGHPGGPGRKPLPAWLRTDKASDELLRLQYQAATTGRIPLAAKGDDDEPDRTDDGEDLPMTRTQEVPAKVRMACAESLLNRIHGKPTMVVESVPPDERAGKLARLYEAAETLERIERGAPAKPDAE